MISKFPFLRNNFAELRQWTVRQKVNQPKNSSSNNSSNSMSSSPSIDIKSENSPLIDRITISSNVTHTNKSKNAQSVTVGNAVKTTSNQNSQSLFEKISSASIPARLSNSLATSLSTGLSASLFSTLTLSLDDLKTSRDLSDPITPPPDLIPLSSTDFGFDFTENEQFKSIEEYDIIPSVVFSEDPLMFFPPTDDKASLDFFDLGDRI
ncbi:hypothetical protein TRFO_13642 [Tritrichomonas foetus]|uniref:Initiator binding domain-containing protein n=1 Tax=Tritrichomonas foetus TaxID=1144522 RepID=A0A1J4L1V5_9EUKA|nr:hypothetical protein TRFO_13642 [Tritrichomonas foetus]|eukprot:OHT15956.1 hypothetical protein TRFO_13642 [Tritrichomonas foetus]